MVDIKWVLISRGRGVLQYSIVINGSKAACNRYEDTAKSEFYRVSCEKGNRDMVAPLSNLCESPLTLAFLLP